MVLVGMEVGVGCFFRPGGVNASRHIECNENTFDLDGDAANGCEVDGMGWDGVHLHQTNNGTAPAC